MQITLDTANLTELDIAVLRCIVPTETTATSAPVSAPKVAKKAAAPTPEAAPTLEAAAAPEPAPAPEDNAEERATARALELVQAGKARVVKEALNGFGAERVSKLAPDQFAPFIDQLSELGVKQIEARLDAEMSS